MSATEAVAAATPAKMPKAKKVKETKAKAPVMHPVYSVMVNKAISELKERSGSSKAAILKYILANFKVGENITKVNAHLRLALKRGVAAGGLKQVKGTGASGSFRIGEKKAAEAPKKAKATKKTGEKKTKAAPAEKKAKSPKKAAAKKPKAKSSKKPASPKKTKSPKKVAAAKPKIAKKAAPKKSAAPKKAAAPKAVKA